MRIAYILNTLGTGGAERLVVSLAERMAARGHAVLIIVLLKEQPEDWKTAVPVVRLGMRPSGRGALRGLARALGAIRRFRPDVIHGNNFHGNLLARTMRLACPAARVISTLHNEYEGGRGRMLALKCTDALTERTVAVCQAVAERALQLGIVPERKMSVITNGIDVDLFSPDAQRRAMARRALDAGDDFVWLSAGRLAEAKDYPTVLRAFANVRAAIRGTQLWIAGTGEEEYAEVLRITAMRFGVADAVQWLGLQRDVAALLDAADGFVLGSAWEGMPLALAEAMAMEKPVVATGVGGVSELTGSCGLVVPPRDPEALARAMLSMMNTPPEARSFLGQSARERVRERFDMDAKAQDWEDLYEEVASRK
jgi:glycosyltransferase involved in cell wall biosynthesis